VILFETLEADLNIFCLLPVRALGRNENELDDE